MDRPADGGQQARRPTAVRTSSAALSGQWGTRRWHHGRRRELLRAAMLLLRAAAWQPSKVCSQAASGRLLPPTECSLRSGCAMDERHGAGMLNSTLRGRGRAIKLTWVSMSVGKHSAAAPAIVGARTCRQPPAWRRCCNLADLRNIACSNALSDPRADCNSTGSVSCSMYCCRSATRTRTDGRVACTVRRI